MSRYFDDELAHSGVKGMKWRKHKYRLVKDANGKLRYVYDNDNTARKQTNGNDAARRMQQETQAKRILADVIKKGGDPNHSYTVGYTDKNGQHISGKYMPNEKSLSAVGFDKNGKVHPVYSKAAKELMADNKRKYEEHNRQERLRRSEANKEQIERRKRRRQAEANKEQIERRKSHRQAEANNQKAKATGKRAKWAYDKPYQSKVEYDQENQRHMLKERDYLKKHGGYHQFGRFDISGNKSASQLHDENYKDEKRWRAREMEGFYNNRANIGQMSRAAESTARHKAAVKAQKKKRITDTIDKGRKAVEEFFTPKKKKKR